MSMRNLSVRTVQQCTALVLGFFVFIRMREWGEIPMSSVSMALKKRKFEKIYKAHVDDIYRVCYYFSRDEEKAQNITVEVFAELYKEFDEMDPDHIFAHLVQRAKRLSLSEQVHNFASGEVTE